MLFLLLECAVRSILLAAGTAVLLRVLRVKAASAQHAAWTGVMAAMLLLPAWTAWGPKAAIPLLPPAGRLSIESMVPQDESRAALAMPAGTRSQIDDSTVARRLRDWRVLLICAYFVGLSVLLTRLALGTVRAHTLRRRAVIRDGMLTSNACDAPVTIGWFRPAVILPQSWCAWPRADLTAVLAHEREHVRRHDPLVQWLALLNRAVFWFHPLAWWLERRLSELAEEACDAAVLDQGMDPCDYCELLLRFARVAASDGARPRVWGMTMPGSALPRRIRQILESLPVPGASRLRKLCAAAACGITSAASIAITIGQSAPRVFDVASIKPSQIARAGGEGSRRERVTVSPTGLTLANVSLSYCIQWAYHVNFYQIAGPDWLIQQRYDILAKSEHPASKEQLRTMLQALLADRFQLRLHRETKTIPIYALVVRKDGAKLRSSQMDQDADRSVADGSFVFRHVTLSEFAGMLSDLAAIGRPVLDKTNIEGAYDLTMKSAARAMLEDPSSIFSAVEDLGLKLESRKGPVDVLVIDRAEKPTPN